MISGDDDDDDNDDDDDDDDSDDDDSDCGSISVHEVHYFTSWFTQIIGELIINQ